MKYDELLADLRGWARAYVNYEGSIYELLDKAADAIEELQKENLRLHAFNDMNLEARDMLHERIKEAEVKHGKWLYQLYAKYECSVCGFYETATPYNFCPNCGARMDGE